LANQVAARAGVTPAGDGAGACPGDRRGERERGERGTEKAGQQSKKPNSFPTRTGPQAQKQKVFDTPTAAWASSHFSDRAEKPGMPLGIKCPQGGRGPHHQAGRGPP